MADEASRPEIVHRAASDPTPLASLEDRYPERWNEKTKKQVPEYKTVQRRLENNVVRCLGFTKGYNVRCENNLEDRRRRQARSLCEGEFEHLSLDTIRSIVILLICKDCHNKNDNGKHVRKITWAWEQHERKSRDLSTIDWAADDYALGKTKGLCRRSVPTTPEQQSHRQQPHDEQQYDDEQHHDEESPSHQPHSHDPIHDSGIGMLEVDMGNLSLSPTEKSQEAQRLRRLRQAPPPPIADPRLRPATINEPGQGVHHQLSPLDPSRDDDPATSATDLPQAAINSYDSKFTPGIGNEWEPSAVVQEVQELLKQEPPARRTSIYAFKDDSTGKYVKIGHTTRTREARRKELVAQSGVGLDKVHYVWKSNIPFELALRLEKVIHTDLAYTQRDCRSENRRHIQREWFEVDWQTAKNCIEFWHGVLTRSRWPIQLNDGVSKDRFLITSERSGRQLNNDHAMRLEYWQELLLKPRKKPWDVFTSWVTGCVGCLVFPYLLNIPQILRFLLSAVAIGVYSSLQLAV